MLVAVNPQFDWILCSNFVKNWAYIQRLQTHLQLESTLSESPPCSIHRDQSNDGKHSISEFSFFLLEGSGHKTYIFLYVLFLCYPFAYMNQCIFSWLKCLIVIGFSSSQTATSTIEKHYFDNWNPFPRAPPITTVI